MAFAQSGAADGEAGQAFEHTLAVAVTSAGVMPVEPATRQLPVFRYDDLHLVALPSAVTCARLFVQFTLPLWNLNRWVPEVEQLAVKLVSSAVKATGPTDQRAEGNKIDTVNRLVLRLRQAETKLVVEVWDASQEAPVGSPPVGYGAGYFLLAGGGKVVWVEVPVWPEQLEPLPR